MEEVLEFKERKGGLIFFGIVELFTGAILLLLSLVILMSLATLSSTGVGNQPQTTVSSIIITFVMYIILAAIFIALGIGSIKFKRWARSLSLLLSWSTFIVGTVTLIILILVGDSIFQQLQNSGQADSNVVYIVRILIYLMIAFLFVIIPGIFILFYQNDNVLHTVQKYDPKVSWADKVPLPILAITFIFFYIAIMPLYYITTGWVLPFFGTYLIGFLAIIIHLINSAVCVYLGINIYRLNKSAWSYSLYYMAFWFVSTLLTLSFTDIFEMYEYMNVTEEQLNLLRSFGFSSLNFAIAIVISWSMLFAFLYYSKKYFNSSKEDEVMSATKPLKADRRNGLS